MSASAFYGELSIFIDQHLQATPNVASLKVQAEKVIQHINAVEELTQQQLDECISNLYAVPQLWATVVTAVAQDIDRLPRGALQEETPRFSVAILESLLQPLSQHRSDFLRSLGGDWTLLKLVRQVLPNIEWTDQEVVDLICHIDTTMEFANMRTTFIIGYSEWALQHPVPAVRIIEEWLSLSPWSAYAHHTSIAMLTKGAIGSPSGGAQIRSRLLDKIFGQRRLHHWLLALHIQVYAYPGPMPDALDRCSALVSTVEKDPLNLSAEAIGLIERHLLQDPESALIALDVIWDSVQNETSSKPPPAVPVALSSVLVHLLQVSRLESRLVVDRLSSLLAFPLMDSRRITRTHHPTLDHLLSALWEKESDAVARFLKEYLVRHSDDIQAHGLTLELLFCGLSHAMGTKVLGRFLIGLLTDHDPNSRKIGAYLLEVSKTQRLPPVEITDEHLQELPKPYAEVVILELAGRAASKYYIGLCLRLLSLHPTLRSECAEKWVHHFVSDYPGACRKAKDALGRLLHPSIVSALEVALQTADEHQRKLNKVNEVFSLATFGMRWHVRENENIKALQDEERDSGRSVLSSMMGTVHLARGARRWGVVGETDLRGTKDIVAEFEGSRLHCASPLLYHLTRQTFLLRSHSLLHSEGGK